LLGALANGPLGTVFVVEAALLEEVRAQLAAEGYVARTLGTPYRDRWFFALEPEKTP